MPERDPCPCTHAQCYVREAVDLVQAAMDTLLRAGHYQAAANLLGCQNVLRISLGSVLGQIEREQQECSNAYRILAGTGYEESEVPPF